MPYSRFLDQSIQNHIFGKATYTAPAHIFVGLSSTTPNPDGTGVTEPSGNGYARVSTAPTDWNSATNATPSVVTNANTVTFPQATGGSWVAGANLTYFVLYDASSAGNFLGYGALDVAKPVVQNDTASFAAGALSATLN